MAGRDRDHEQVQRGCIRGGSPLALPGAARARPEKTLIDRRPIARRHLLDPKILDPGPTGLA